MQQLDFKMDDITEEKISDLVTFLDNPWTWVNPRMAMLYWRLRARGNIINKADERLDKDIQKKKESYKWKIINEIKQWLEDMKNENWWWYNPYRYEIANIKSREDWKTLLIWFRDIDENWKTKRKHSVLIEEKYNPDFFKEMLDKYIPQEEKNLDSKPF